jgi:hypothetical protein
MILVVPPGFTPAFRPTVLGSPTKHLIASGGADSVVNVYQ